MKNTFTILVASSSFFFIQLHVVCLTFEILFTTILHFLTSEAHLFVFQVGSHIVKIVVRTRDGLFVISWEPAWTLLILEVFRHYHSWTEPFRKRSSSLYRWDECIRCNPSQNAAFFTKSEHTIKQAVALSSPVSTVYARNAWGFTWLLPSFSQH